MTPAAQANRARAASVVLPTYNERENIVPLISQILEQGQAAGWDVQVVVVDDDSPDGTAELVRSEFVERSRVKVVVRKNQRGLATAIRRGINEAGHSVLVLMDSDFNHHPRYLPSLLAGLEGADMVLGSRYLPGGGMNTSRLRYLCSMAFNRWLRLLLAIPTSDNLSGFLVMDKELMLSFDQDYIFSGYGDFAIRLLYLAHQRGMNIKEIPVVYENRLGGESKTRFVHHLVQYTRAALELRRRGH